MDRRTFISIISLAACLGSQVILANSETIDTLPLLFTTRPMLTFSGFIGSEPTGEIQGMIPIISDINNNFYGELEGRVNHNSSYQWWAGGGLGYRTVINDRILGSYLLADYNHTPERKSFWTGDLGLESFGELWDFRANGYMPLATKEQDLRTDTAFNFGFGAYQHFGTDAQTAHYYYDHMFTHLEEVGTGIDVEVGRSLPIRGLKIHTGAYYFNYKNFGGLKGIDGRLTYKINDNFTLEAKDSYDNNFHNTALVGLKFSLGGINNEDRETFAISGRLMDRIEHNFAPVINMYRDNGKQLISKDVWFFKEDPSSPAKDTKKNTVLGSGTYFDPFIGVDQSTIDAINAHPRVGDPWLFFANVTPAGGSTSYTPPTRLTIPKDFRIFGKTADYLNTPYNNDRPLFRGEMDLPYGYNTIANFRFQNTPELVIHGQAIAIGPNTGSTLAGPVDLSNIQIGTPKSSSSDWHWYDQFTTGILLNNVRNGSGGGGVTIKDLSVYAYSEGPLSISSIDSTGITANNSIVNFSGGTNFISALSFGNVSHTGADEVDSFGIQANNGSIINFISGANTISAVSDSPYTTSGVFQAYSYGIQANSSAIKFIGGTNNINSSGSLTPSTSPGFGDTTSFGIMANASSIDFIGGINNISSNSFINGDKATYSSQSIGILASTSTITFAGGTNTIDSHAVSTPSSNLTQTYSYGIAASNSIINFAQAAPTAKNTINVSSTNPSGNNEHIYGIEADAASHLQKQSADVVGDLSQLVTENYVAFNSHPGATNGYKIEWQGHIPPTVPW